MKPGAREKLLNDIREKEGGAAFEDRTVDDAKPNSYIFARALGYVVIPDGSDHLLPGRPFAEVEEWSGGQMIDSARADDPEAATKLAAFRRRGMDRLTQRGLHFLTIPPLFQAAFTGRLTGNFPWKGDKR